VSTAPAADSSTAAVADVHELHLATSGKLKLRATARLAEGEPAALFEACVLLHEAARAERRAIEALPFAPATTHLAASIEECWCLVEGFDPPRAADAWGRVLADQDRVDPDTAGAMLSRLRPRFEESRRRFGKVLSGCPRLMRLHGGQLYVPVEPSEQRAMRAELTRVLDAFPGAVPFWWASYRLGEAMGDLAGAWTALTNARLLDPENRRFEAMSLLLSVRALPEKQADEHIGRARASLEAAGPQVCLMYALAEIEMAARAGGKKAAERWRRALHAVFSGLGQGATPDLQKNLKAIRLLLEALLAGVEPTLDILYRAGLGDRAVMAQRQSVTDLLIFLASQVAANDAQPLAASR